MGTDILDRLKLTMEYEVVRSLLASDTQCFSTSQYMEARDRWIEKYTGATRESLGIGAVTEHEIQMARKQLLSVPQLVKEFRSDVWVHPENWKATDDN